MSEAAAVGGSTNLYHLQLMEILGINPELSYCNKTGLKWYYKKYKVFNAAVQTMDQMGKWPLGKKPSQTEIVDIFMLKSYFPSHLSKPFSAVASYPQMVAWLKDEDDSLSEFEVWHVQKSEYGFKELNQWILKGGTLDIVAKGKMESMKKKKENGKKTERRGIGKEKEKKEKKEMEKGKGTKKRKEKEKEKEKEN